MSASRKLGKRVSELLERLEAKNEYGEELEAKLYWSSTYEGYIIVLKPKVRRSG